MMIIRNFFISSLLFIFFLLLSTDVQAQPLTHLWSQGFGDSSIQAGEDVGIDVSGNVLVTGRQEGTVDFGGGPLTSAGDYDVFIAKFTSGGAHIWSKRFGDSDFQTGQCIAGDPSGNVLLTGRMQGIVDFGGSPLVGAGLNDIFIAKFNSSGTHMWSQRFGDSSHQFGRSIAADASGNVIALGDFYQTVDFGGGPMTAVGDWQDIYVVKFDPSGGHIWSKQYGDSSYQNAHSVAVDPSGNILLIGNFAGNVDFGGGALNSAGDFDVCVAKLDPNGNHIWSQGFGDVNTQWGRSVACDPSGNVAITGFFQGTVDFGGGPIISLGAGNNDIFIAKFDPSGNHLWSKGFGDTNDQAGYSIAADDYGNIVVTGRFAGSVNFGGGVLTSAGDNDIFIAEFDPNGNHLQSQGFGDASGQMGMGIVCEPSGDIYAAGQFEGSVDFGGGTLASSGNLDIFLAKFEGYDPSNIPMLTEWGMVALILFIVLTGVFVVRRRILGD